MTAPAWQVRVATGKDRALLAGFRCAGSENAWEREVELAIQSHLLDWALAPGAAADDPTVLLLFDAARVLVGVAAHERQSLGTNALDKVAATKIQLAAVSVNWQGKTFSSGERISDVVMNAALTDIATHVPPRDSRIFAIVHELNAKSIALCKRFGLDKELLRPHENYLMLANEHKMAT